MDSTKLGIITAGCFMALDLTLKMCQETHANCLSQHFNEGTEPDNEGVWFLVKPKADLNAFELGEIGTSPIIVLTKEGTKKKDVQEYIDFNGLNFEIVSKGSYVYDSKKELLKCTMHKAKHGKAVADLCEELNGEVDLRPIGNYSFPIKKQHFVYTDDADKKESEENIPVEEAL